MGKRFVSVRCGGALLLAVFMVLFLNLFLSELAWRSLAFY